MSMVTDNVAEVHVPRQTKLSAPIISASNIPRARILQLIAETTTAKVVLLKGQAGSGKTTAMLQYYEQQNAAGVRTSWINLDREDDNVERFLACIGFAAHRMSGSVHTALRAPLTDSDWGAGAISRLCEIEQPFVVFMDEFEVIGNSAVLDLVRRIIDCLPIHGRLVIGTRVVPNLSLGRLRANAQLLEIGLEYLLFSLNETDALLRGKYQPPLSDAEVRLLQRRSEGWPAGLQLASKSSLCPDTRRHLDATLSGSNPEVADYFAQYVLAGVSAEVQDFLLRASVLDQLSAPLCDAMLGHTHSGRLIAHILNSHLFLTPLDVEHSWYRFHSMFADFLRTQLNTRHPQLADHLHHAASVWYAAAGRPVPAIEHALSARGMKQVTDLLCEYVPNLHTQCRFSLLGRWFHEIPSAVFESCPQLRFPFAWALASIRRPTEALRLVDDAQRACEGRADESSTRAWCTAVRLINARQTDELRGVEQPCDRDWVDVPAASPHLCGLLAQAQAECLVNRNQFEEAVSRLGLCISYRKKLTYPSCLPINAGRTHAVLDFARGHLRDAQARLRRTVSEVDWDRDEQRIFGGSAGVLLAELCYQSDDLLEAERLLSECMPLCVEHGLPDGVISGYVTSARVAYAKGNRERALELLVELEHIGIREALPRLILSSRLERARLALYENDACSAEIYLKYAEKSDIWASLQSCTPHANDVDQPAIARNRLLIHTGHHEEALTHIERCLLEAEQQGRLRRVLKLKTLLAMALEGTGQSERARRTLQGALQFAANQGFVRTFAEEGHAMTRLLIKARDKRSPAGVQLSRAAQVPSAFIEKVLQACGHNSVNPREQLGSTPQPHTQVLTKSELRVLKLVAEGLSNAAIADKLFIAPTTVNAHLRKINERLAVKNRTQAVTAARRLGLLRID